MSLMRLVVRQLPGDTPDDDNNDDNNDDSGWWWWSPTAYAIKWAIVAALFLFFLVFVVGGYLHAQRRMKKGLQPLAYHRWLVTRRQRARFDPQYQNQYPTYRPHDGFPMPNYAPPPPAYNAENDYVPAYEPPVGSSKVNPNQDYAPPAGPPPPRFESGPSLPVRAASAFGK